MLVICFVEEHDARKLPWMPKELPPHVKVIFSCLPDDKFQVLEAAKKHWGAGEANLVQVDELPVSLWSKCKTVSTFLSFNVKLSGGWNSNIALNGNWEVPIGICLLVWNRNCSCRRVPAFKPIGGLKVV